MNRILNIIIFISLLCLVVIANGSFFGISIKEENKQASKLDAHSNVIYTMPVAEDISGYGGAIPLAIALDDNNVILEIEILKNAEDPNYLGKVVKAKYLDKWVGLPMEKVALLDVDAVSGATLSSKAISQSIKLKAQDFTGIKAQENEGIDIATILKVLALIFVIITALAFFYYPAKLNKYRKLLLIANILVLGFWEGAMLSIFNISNWLINGIPNIYSYIVLVIFLLSILIPLFTKKNFYCMYLCPFGSSQELVSKAIKIKNPSISKLFFKGLEHAKIVILMACFILLILGLGANIAMLEPFSAFHPKFASFTAVIIFVLSLVLSAFVPRAWCRYFCPCGAFLDLFKRKGK